MIYRVTASDNQWQRAVEQVTINDNKWQWMATMGTTSDKEWQRVVILANFPFFQIREEPTTKHPKKNF